jgi:hypothetical protein
MEIKNRQNLLLIIAAGGLLLLVLDWAVIEPLKGSWNERVKRIAELKKSVADGKQLLSRKELILGRWDRIRTNTLPANVSQAEGQLLQAFNRWAQESRVNIGSIRPQWRESGEDYMTLECRADATGDIRQISRFLYEVEKDQMALKVESIELSSRDNNGRDLTLGLQVSGLVLSSQEQ